MKVLTREQWAQVASQMYGELGDLTEEVMPDFRIPGRPAKTCVAVTGGFATSVIFLTHLAAAITWDDTDPHVQMNELRHLAGQVVKEWQRGTAIHYLPDVRVEQEGEDAHG